MAKSDSYNSGYANARKLAADCGAEPEHHAYGGKMGRMPIRAPRLSSPRLREPSLGAMGVMPGGPPGPGMPGLGAAPGPMPMPGGPPPMPGGGMPGLKHGGKAKHKKMAKGGVVKKAAGGGLAQVARKGGAASAEGPMTKAHIVNVKSKSKGKNAIKGG